MTNEPIKPGYYWAKYKSEVTPDLFSVYTCQINDELLCRRIGSIIDYFPSEIRIIAPALPPDQWPTYETMCAASDKVDGSFKKHTFERGFRACYKLFTGKDLQIK